VYYTVYNYAAIHKLEHYSQGVLGIISVAMRTAITAEDRVYCQMMLLVVFVMALHLENDRFLRSQSVASFLLLFRNVEKLASLSVLLFHVNTIYTGL